ncbi:MAG: hypothetical protein K2X73_04800 [Sphingomonas sp.]|uniref:hypothetical protein n=1 Tax=Sphingomonas sp. TaxID=28214 RepID=UPI0025F1EF28|nr:hypothetical protein [Sphingomonas sp.]MBX9881273.1 hypothetical protein [Sphingomonas sp.]
MSELILVEAQPWAPDGTPVAVRLAGGGSRGYTHRGFLDWVPGIASKPRFTAQIGFNVADGGFTGGAVPTTGALGFLPSDPAVISALAQLVWTDAPITVWVGDDDLADPVWTTLLVGTVAGMIARGGQASFTIADLSRDLAKPLLTDRFAGTGGVEGIPEAKERIKRRSWGRCWNVEARILDKANSIYELGDPARPLLAIDAVKDKGRAADQVTVLGWQGSVAATFAALQAASAPAGGAVVAPSIGCVKWWTQPAGPLTADLRGETGTGYVESCAAIAARVIAARAPTMAVTGLAEAIAARPGACGLHVDQDSETAGQALDRLLLGASLLWIVEPTGVVRLAPIAFTGAVETQVAIEAEREAVYKPVTERLLGYQRNQRQHSDGELSAVFQASDGTYRDGTPIEDLKPAERGANVTQTNVAAAISGQGALATRSTVTDGYLGGALSVRLAPHPLNSNFLGTDTIAYPGGAGVSALQPQEAGANVTEARVASAIAGQGALATISSLGYGSPLLTGFGGLAPLDRVRLGVLGAGGIVNAANSQWLGDADLITLLGTAAAISGQGALATRSTVTDGYLGGALSVRLAPHPLNSNYLGTDTIAYPGGTGVSALQPQEAGANVTEARVASAISGQSAWATYGAVAPVTVAARVSRIQDDGYIYSSSVYNDIGSAGVLRDRWPAEFGANVTESRVASAIAGQGALATQNNAGWSQITSVPTRLRPSPIFGESWLDISVLPYSNGAGVDTLRPQEAGANVTETRVASAISGQGALATISSLGYGSPLLTGFGGLAPLDRVRLGVLGAGGIVNAANSQWLGDADLITLLGTAAAISGQGALATRSTVTDGYLGGALSVRLAPHPLNSNYLGTDTIAYPGGAGVSALQPQEAGANVTEARVASAISGQSAWATYGAVAPVTVAARVSRIQDDGYIYSSSVYNDIGSAGVLRDRWPAEFGANVTEARVASGIAGQGALATISSLGYGSPLLTGFGGLAPLDRVRLGVLGAGGIVNAANSQWLGDADLITLLGTAAAISGQGALATRSTVTDGYLGGALSVRLAPHPLNSNYLGTDTIAYPGGAGVSALQPQEAGANVTEARVASAISGQSAWATYGGLVPGNVAGQVQYLNTSGNLDGLARVIDRRLTLLVRADGTTVVTETLVVTAIGVAAAIAGQGAGATANTLAQLDPTAASRLAAISGGGVQVAALYATIRKVMAPGDSINLDAAAGIQAGGDSGNVRVIIQVSPADANAWSNVATGAYVFVGASEPAYATAAGSFTNSSGQQVYEFRAIVDRTSETAGGAVVSSQSFLRG